MVTISQSVKKIVEGRPLLVEGLREGILSNAALARHIGAKVDADIGGKAKPAAIVMALRRHKTELKGISTKTMNAFKNSEISMKTGIFDLVIRTSISFPSKLEKLYHIVKFQKGEVLNIIYGNNEVSIITNEKHASAIMNVLSGEEILSKEKGLVIVALSLPKEYLHTLGVIYEALRKLMWDNSNILEIISTSTELIFVVSEADSARTYNSIQELVKKS